MASLLVLFMSVSAYHTVNGIELLMDTRHRKLCGIMYIGRSFECKLFVIRLKDTQSISNYLCMYVKGFPLKKAAIDYVWSRKQAQEYPRFI